MYVVIYAKPDRIIFCDDKEQVQTSIVAKGDWKVFKLVGCRFERCSVCFKPDGKTIATIETE